MRVFWWGASWSLCRVRVGASSCRFGLLAFLGASTTHRATGLTSRGLPRRKRGLSALTGRRHGVGVDGAVETTTTRSAAAVVVVVVVAKMTSARKIDENINDENISECHSSSILTGYDSKNNDDEKINDE